MTKEELIKLLKAKRDNSFTVSTYDSKSSEVKTILEAEAVAYDCVINML